MDRRTVVTILMAIAMVCSLIPGGSVAADSPEEKATGISTVGLDALVTDRVRTHIASNGIARTDTEGVLEQRTRKHIYEEIHRTPGIDLSELVENAAVSRSTVRYHANVLEDAGLIESTTVAGTLRFAPTGVNAELAGVLNAEPTRTVLDAVFEHEPASVTTIAETTEKAPSTVSHHLSVLETRKFVDRERTGESVVTSLTSETRTAIESALSTE